MPPIYALSRTQETELQSLVMNFPQQFGQVVTDWNRFTVIDRHNAFTSTERDEVLQWFSGFPRFWWTIRPSYIYTGEGLISPHRVDLAATVDKFTRQITDHPDYTPEQLGIAPLIIAGIAIAALFGVGGAVWAVGYWKEQGNISRMLEEVAAGRLPAEVLQAEIENAGGSSPLGDLAGIMKYAAIGAGLVIAWPILSSLAGKVART